MDAAPPAYEDIIDKDPWHLVVRYVTVDDLLSMVLVCKKWHERLSPQLWGNPTSHFGAREDRASTAMVRFIRNLPHVRTSLKELTHTLDIPQAMGDFEDWQQADWLRNVLDQLYTLQALVVRSAPIFDHASLLALSQHGSPDSMTGQWQSSGLRLLDASSCRNATSAGIEIALEHLPMLVYVDFSRTPAAKKYTVLEKFRLLQYLRVLKLQAVGLTDDNLLVLAKAISTKVRSLDLTGNRLSDASVDILLDHCQLPADTFNSIQTRTTTEFPRSRNTLVQSDRFEDRLHLAFTTDFIDDLSFDDGIDIGLTHLRIGENFLQTSLPKLFEYPGFNVLDVGSRASDARYHLDFSTFSALLARLTYLRIHHTAVISPFARLSATGKTFVFPPEQMYALDQVIARRQGLSARHQSESPHSLLPNLPGLRTLVLSGIPATTPNDDVARGIIAFVKHCALHAALARRQAELDYSRPPGTSVDGHAATLFPLETIVLELAASSSSSGSKAGVSASSASPRGLSATNDADSNVFLAASAGDFSFFGDDGPRASGISVPVNLAGSETATHDVVAEVAAFRTEALRKYSAAKVADGDASFVACGYWPGTVRVVRF